MSFLTASTMKGGSANLPSFSKLTLLLLHLQCNTGLHASPAEKPVTCCKAVRYSCFYLSSIAKADGPFDSAQGYRSNSAGVCAKSTDGKQ